MKIVEVDLRQRFGIVDGYAVKNSGDAYHCPWCAYTVYFDIDSLRECSNYYNGLNPPEKGGRFWVKTTYQTAVSKLNDEYVKLFEKHVNKHFQTLKREGDKFIVDFQCPKCKAPVVIMFLSYEIHMGCTIYEPVTVWEVDKWDTKDV